jgi:hypothetical protein
MGRKSWRPSPPAARAARATPFGACTCLPPSHSGEPSAPHLPACPCLPEVHPRSTFAPSDPARAPVSLRAGSRRYDQRPGQSPPQG